MSNENTNKSTADVKDFSISRANKLKEIYSDDIASKRRYGQNAKYKSKSYADANAVRSALESAANNRESIVETSKQLYATNPIYASVINYLANMYSWRYKITPHKVYVKSKKKAQKQMKTDEFNLMYNLMLEVVDGIGIETKFPALLSLLFTNGGVYFSTCCDEDSISIDTILLPDKYCRKIGETQFGTSIIQFDFAYFDSMGLSNAELDSYLKTFPKEFLKLYKAYKKDSNKQWQTLDPAYSSGILLNELSIPTYFYLYGGILDYEKYQDIELERNENLLKYLVVHKMPIYEDKLVFEVDEVKAIHSSLKRIVDTSEKARLITTYGDVHVDKISENDRAENEVLSKAFKSIFNNAGFNSGIFTSETVEGLKMSLVRDKAVVWKYVQALLNFYTIAINNWFDFKMYEADIDILPISPYTYSDDIESFKANASLGVGKLDYIIASGIKQRNIADQLYLEDFLKLGSIKPMQTSYTQTAEDRAAETNNSTNDNSNKKTTEDEIEPLDSANEVKEVDEVVEENNN